MTEDVPYLYHHNTDLAYICGITEPGALLLAERGSDKAVRFILFVEDRDESKELWDGPLCGTGDEIKAYFGVDEMRSASDLPLYLSDAVGDISTFHCEIAINNSITTLLTRMRATQQETLVSKWDHANSPKSFLLRQRLIKSEPEIALLRRAGQIISESLNDTMALTVVSPERSFVEEKYIDAVIEFGCKSRGASRLSFPSVVASGTNGVILHYMNNNRRAADGDFVMVDAGCEFHGYSSDVSRSWPVSGKFSPAQRDMYELVLSVQKKCITLATEGVTSSSKSISLDAMHLIAVRDLVYGLLHLGFMKEHSVESAISSGVYRKYFPHATGHYLGMDVHDTHQLSKSLSLQDGMVITVEPGIYCPLNDSSVPAAFRGLGMRIEDDVVVGGPNEKPEILSSKAVKEIKEIESLMASRKDQLMSGFGMNGRAGKC